MAKFKHFSVDPRKGGQLLTDVSGETPDLNNYAVKEGWRRLTQDQETIREGDAHFQPNQSVPPGSQPFPPVIPGDPILLVHDAIFPNGTVVTIVGTATSIFVLVNQDSAFVYEVGPEIVGIDLTTNVIKLRDDWTGEFLATNTFYVDQSTFNDARYTVAGGGSTYDAFLDVTTINIVETIPSSMPDGVVVAPTYGNAIVGISTVNKEFVISGDHTGSFLDTNTFHVVGTDNNNERYTVNGDSTYSAGPDETTIVVLDTILSSTLEGFVMPVFETELAWLEIASDLEPGHRWEMFNVDGFVIFNNGKELPFTWELDDPSVTPIYELREQGVGAVETITEFNGALLCGDILDIPQGDLLGILNGADPFGVYEEEVDGDRRRFRLLWSAFGKPRRFGVTVDGSITATTPTLTLNYKPVEWVVGTSLLIVGAGASGGNLTAAITNIVGLTITLDTNAGWTVTNEDVFQSTDLEQAPVPGGFKDLQDDSTGILRMSELRGRLVVFKDTTIMMSNYTGDVNNPFEPVIVHRGANLYWRWSLAKPKNRDVLVYAGEYDFFQFDTASQKPKEIPALLGCRDSFFSQVQEADAELIYASDNEATHEIWFNFPSDALAFDYQYNTCSMVGREYTASKTIMRPREGINQRAEERWFVGGRSDGVIVMYGLTNLDQLAFAGGKTVYGLGAKYSITNSAYQIGTTVRSDGFFFADTDVGSTIVWNTGETAVITNYIGQATVEVDTFQEVDQGKFYIFESYYSSVLESGWGHFGDRYNEKDVRGYLFEASSNTNNAPEVQIEIETNRNTNDTFVSEVDVTLDNIDEDNMIPTLIRGTYFRDRITISDYRPVILSARTWEASKKKSRSMTRTL